MDKRSTKKAGRSAASGHQVRGASTEGVRATQAKQAGARVDWHYGRVSRLGGFEIAGGREVVIVWDEGGSAPSRATSVMMNGRS